MDATPTRPRFSWWKLARSFIGLLLAPALGAVIAITLFMIPEYATSRESLADLPGVAGFAVLFGMLFGAIPALIIGWPLHLFLLSRRWTSIWVYCGLGAVLGVASVFVMVPILEFLD